ncbi:HlyD family efflux transporter periplasmic adaptor subunit [Marinobacteraceae bacterium S3BR75-40.1]
MQKGRWFFWSLMAVLAIVAVVFALRPDPVWVDVDSVHRAPMKVTITEEGKTRVQDRYVISAPVSGYLHRIEGEVGDAVIPGEWLTEIEPLPASVLDARSLAEARARVEAAKSSVAAADQRVEAAEADAQLAREELRRLQRLNQTDFVSRDALEQAQATQQRNEAMARSARFQAEVARHELAAARTRLDISAARENGDEDLDVVAIHSPVNGAILAVYRESEGVVQAGEALLELGDPGALDVEVDVLSFDAVKLAPGMAVRLTEWGGDPLQGTVSRVEPVGYEDVSALGVEEQRVRVIVQLASPRKLWESLGDGYRVTAEFVLWENDDVLQVPASAVFDHEGGEAVFVVENDEARLVPVETGRSNGLATQITGGVTAGTTVIRHPGNQVEVGTRVSVR